ncbi:baseplate J/gp47 family protein [Lysinibacillus capsici]|uniref:baseplate assembly protein n=1 Tax=Lysinibacillus capsici TaxID=2115968 RepID=UPI0032E42CB6
MTQVVLPEINFLETDAQKLVTDIISTYENLEGRKLAQADPLRLIFLTCASVITKQNVAINDAAKQNLLYYARGNVLKHKGAEFDTPILEATAATTTLRMHLSAPLSSSRIIKAGELLATSNEGVIFFVSTHDAVIETTDLFVDINLKCTVAGPEGNDFSIGEINSLVKPLPYIDRVENITVSAGGAYEEDEESYRNRIFLAPEKLSNAGPTGAYEYYARSASPLISDIFVDSPQPGYVNISVLLKNGELPSEEIIQLIYEKVNARDVRPLTDFITVSAPEIVTYDLDVVYYIETNAVDKEIIHKNVEKAIEDYAKWQSSKHGRDINPSKLISDCYKAGAKRIDVRSPNFMAINKRQVAVIENKTVTFGGLEDD